METNEFGKKLTKLNLAWELYRYDIFFIFRPISSYLKLDKDTLISTLRGFNSSNELIKNVPLTETEKNSYRP